MQSLGILTDNRKYEVELQQLFKELEFQLITIKEKDSFNQLSGLIIHLSKKNSLAEVIDWLLFSRSNPEVFIWLIYKDSVVHEQNILLELGANDVITTDDELAKLPYIVKNTFSRIRIVKEDTTANLNETSFLNEENQTVWVNKEERPLTRTEFRLLSILYDRINTTVSYEELFEETWSDECENQLFRVSNVVFHLREKINDSNKYEIKTTRSKGYMLKEKNN